MAIATPHLGEKLGDAKLKKPASDALMLFAEQTSLQFVLSHGKLLETSSIVPYMLTTLIT